MALKEIITQYDGKCTECGRELKKGWTIFFDGQTSPKTVLCKPCGIKAGGSSEKTTVSTENMLTPEEIAQLPPEIQEKLALSGLMPKLSLEDKVDFIYETISDTNTDTVRKEITAVREMCDTRFSVLLQVMQSEFEALNVSLEAVAEKIKPVKEPIKKE